MAFGKARDKELLSAKREVAAILFLAFPAATGRGGTRPSPEKPAVFVEGRGRCHPARSHLRIAGAGWTTRFPVLF